MTDFLVLDFEFTTFGDNIYGRPRAFFPEIIEVGAVLLDHELKETGSYQTFVKPTFYPKLTNACKNLTMISQQDVDDGIAFNEMLDYLKKIYCPNKTLWVAWGDADREVIFNACKRYRLDSPFIWDDYIDLSAEYKGFFGQSYRISLKNALIELKIEPDGIPHTALADTQNAAKILTSLYNQGWRPGTIKNEAMG